MSNPDYETRPIPYEVRTSLTTEGEDYVIPSELERSSEWSQQEIFEVSEGNEAVYDSEGQDIQNVSQISGSDRKVLERATQLGFISQRDIAFICSSEVMREQTGEESFRQIKFTSKQGQDVTEINFDIRNGTAMIVEKHIKVVISKLSFKMIAANSKDGANLLKLVMKQISNLCPIDLLVAEAAVSIMDPVIEKHKLSAVLWGGDNDLTITISFQVLPKDNMELVVKINRGEFIKFGLRET